MGKKQPPLKKPANRTCSWIVLVAMVGVVFAWLLFRLRIMVEEPPLVVDPPVMAMQLEAVRGAGLLGEWVHDPIVLFEIKQALKKGRLVTIRNVLAKPVAERLRSELLEDHRSNWSKESSAGTRAMLELAGVPIREVWRDDSGINMCQSLHEELNQLRNQLTEEESPAMPDGWEVFSQQHLWKPQSLGSPTHKELKALMESQAMQELAGWLVGGPVGSVESHVAKQRQGDFIEPHAGNSPAGRLLTANFYLSQDSFNLTEHGGSFVWCLPFTQFVDPTFNSLALFRVSAMSWHVLEPLWHEHAPQRLEMSVWYKMAGDPIELRNDPWAQEWASEDTLSEEGTLIVDW